MYWIFPALFSSFFAATVNHIDKQLLSRFFKGAGPGSLVIFSSFVGIPVTALLWMVYGQQLRIGFQAAGVLMLAGMLYMAAVFPYLHAMQRDDADVVAPLFQLISAIGYIFGVLLLGEYVEIRGVMGGVLVLAGAILLSLEFKNSRRIRMKREVFLLMLLSSTIFALNGVLFKSAAIKIPSFWVSAFWDYLGVSVFGIIVYLTQAGYRRQFHEVIRGNSRIVLSLNVVNEACAVAAQLLLHFASLLAPLAVVFWIAEGFQPVFVFLLAALIACMDRRQKEKFFRSRLLLQKIGALALMLLGTYLLWR